MCDGTLRVIRAARDAGVKRVVMTSSISAIIYGRGVREKPFTEEDWTDGTNRDDSSPYDRKSPTWRHGRGLRPKTGSSSSSRSTPVWFSAPFSDQTFLLRLRRSGSFWTARYPRCRAWASRSRTTCHRCAAITGDDHAFGCWSTLHRLLRILFDGRHRQDPQTGVGRESAEGPDHFHPRFFSSARLPSSTRLRGGGCTNCANADKSRRKKRDDC